MYKEIVSSLYRVKAATLRPSFGAFSLLYCAGRGIDPRPRRFRNFYENFAERGSQSDRLHPVYALRRLELVYTGFTASTLPYSYIVIANSGISPFRPDGASWRQSELQGEGVPPQPGGHHVLPELLPHLLMSLEKSFQRQKSPK